MQIYEKSVHFSNALLKRKMIGGRVLDVGGAEYALRANEISENVDEVVILDIKPPELGLAGKVAFFELPVEKLTPDTLGYFDHILMSNVLEHLENPWEVVKKCAAVLSEKGNIHILSPNCESLNRRIGVIMGLLKSLREIPEKEVRIGHVHALSVQDIKDMLEQVALELAEVLGVFLKPVPTPEMITWPEERIRAFFEIAPQVPPELCHEVYFRAGRKH